MSTTQSTENTDTSNIENTDNSSKSSTIPPSKNNKPNTNSQTDNEDSVPSYTFADALKTIIKPTDLDKPIDYYQYDTNPKIVNIITGEDDIEKTETTEEIQEIEDVKTPEFNQPDEKDYNNDINQYDNEGGEIPEKLLPINYPNMFTSDDERDIPEKDDTKYENPTQIYTKNPYISTLVFFIPAISVVLLIMGFNGVLTFDKFLYALGGSSLLWFIISWFISISNKNTPQGLFTSGGEVNTGSDTTTILSRINDALKLIDEILIKTLFSIVTFFTDYFRESLKIKNIRKMFFLFSLSLTMMAFLFILNTIFPFPIGIPTSIL
jgi:hypothetical protein